MSIYKRGETYWIQFTDQHGNRVQQSAKTKNKAEAQQLHDRLKAESWKVKHTEAKPKYTWNQAVVKWLTEQEHKRSIETDKVHLRWLDQYLSSVTLESIGRDLLDSIREKKRQTGVSNATVNRVMSIIRAILNKAKDDWEWIDTVPAFRSLQEPFVRIRWLTYDEAQRLLDELPPHLAAMARFSLSTGLREANVTGLKWSQVDLDRECAWITANQAKGRKAIPVPLNQDALSVLRLERGKHPESVFTYKGNPVLKAGGKAWRHALSRAGITDFRWHDLRHTWASWHIQKGTPVTVLKELGAWSDLSIVMRYAHLSSEQLKTFSGNSSIESSVTNLLHYKKSA
jgi:integrase